MVTNKTVALPSSTPEANRCVKCGESLSTTANFCGHCGSPTGESTRAVPNTISGSTSSLALLSGTALHGNSYVIESILGQGGFGITYRATDKRLNRPVAIKELYLSEVCERRNNGVIARSGMEMAFKSSLVKFCQEGRMLARFDHPGIVKVLAIFEENGTAYLIMEHLTGPTLAEMLAKKRVLSATETTPIVAALAAALSQVHEAKSLHRDVNPANIVLTKGRGPVLIDFGLSKQMPDQSQYATRNLAATTALGTPAFAAPEQYSRQAVFGPEVDVYGLAATTYFMLTGQSPIPASARLAGEALRSPDTVNPNVSVTLGRAVMAGMALGQGERFATVDGFANALKDAGTDYRQGAILPSSQAQQATVAPPPASTPGMVSGGLSVAPQTVAGPVAGQRVFYPRVDESWGLCGNCGACNRFTSQQCQGCGQALPWTGRGMPIPNILKISGQMIEAPNSCSCCGAKPLASFRAARSKNGDEIIRSVLTPWRVPHCEGCERHFDLAEKADAMAYSLGSAQPLSPNYAPSGQLEPPVTRINSENRKNWLGFCGFIWFGIALVISYFVGSIATGFGVATSIAILASPIIIGVFLNLSQDEDGNLKLNDPSQVRHAYKTMEQAVQAMQPSCSDVRPSVEWKDRSGTVSTFAITNTRYLGQIVDLNAEKIIN